MLLWPNEHGKAPEQQQQMAKWLHQNDTVITFDLAIYVNAQLLQWKFPEQLKNAVVRMGGSTFALNPLSLLRKRFSNLLEDLLVESGLYAAGTTATLMLGRSYNCRIHAQKLTMEALFRLLWQVFAKWLKS